MLLFLWKIEKLRKSAVDNPSPPWVSLRTPRAGISHPLLQTRMLTQNGPLYYHIYSRIGYKVILLQLLCGDKQYHHCLCELHHDFMKEVGVIIPSFQRRRLRLKKLKNPT